MTTTNSMTHLIERGLLGLAGSSLVIMPPAFSWYDLNVHQPPEVRLASLGFGAVLLLAWLLSIYVCTREPETHFWGCIIKGAGVPAVLVALGQVGQIAIT